MTEGDLVLRDVVIEIEGAADGGRREAGLVSAALVDTTRLMGSAVGRVLGRRGDFEVAFVGGLVTLTSFGDSASVPAGRKSVSILVMSELERTGFFRSLGDSRST